MTLPFPTETQCPCGTVFTQPQRIQGGGRRTIYCSKKCQQLAWRLGHAKQRKATILKYDSRPENKAQRSARQRRKTLTKYGMTEADFQALLLRQRGRCAGCERELTSQTARIDHNHETGRVRGLLCDQCNWTLGFVHDSRATLYQLAAHLELNRTRRVVYLIGSLRNPQVVHVGNAIRALGFECIDNWFATGKIADDAWRDYSNAQGKTYQEALASREAGHVYYFDRAYLNLCDAVVLLYPAGKSGHIELGYAAGKGKPGFILMPEIPTRYDVMLQFAGGTVIFFEEEKLLAALREELS